jgi:hypothetical protein
MTGIILMSAFLGAVVVLGGTTYLLSRLLPQDHPVRRSIEAAAAWIKSNPNLVEKRLKQVAFGALVLTFILLTLIYS